MSIARKMFLEEWIDRRGLQNNIVAKAIGTSETHLSRMAKNKLKTRPRTKTLERLAEVLRCPNGYEDLFRHPDEVLSEAVRREHSPPDDCIDLDQLADDPNLRMKGKPLTPEQRSALRFIIRGLGE